MARRRLAQEEEPRCLQDTVLQAPTPHPPTPSLLLTKLWSQLANSLKTKQNKTVVEREEIQIFYRYKQKGGDRLAEQSSEEPDAKDGARQVQDRTSQRKWP